MLDHLASSRPSFPSGFCVKAFKLIQYAHKNKATQILFKRLTLL